MSKLQQFASLIAAEAAVTADMNEAERGGGGKLLPAGYGLGRIVEYIDLGMQPQEFQGKAKEPAAEFRLGIAFTSPGYANEDGTPYLHRAHAMPLSRFERSNTYKAFKAMNWTNDPNIRHFAHFLGRAFAFKIVHKTSKATGKPYCIIDWASTLAADPVSNVPYDNGVPAVPDELYNLFLWNNPTLEGWDALHIDGTNDDGTSKNWLQETILAAKDFPGSPLQMLLVQNGRDATPRVPAATDTSGEAVQAAQAPVAAAPTAAPAQAPVAAPVADRAVQAAPGSVAPALAGVQAPVQAQAQVQQVAAPLAQQAAIAAPSVAPPGPVEAQPPAAGSPAPSASTATTSPSNPQIVAPPALVPPAAPAV